MKRILSAILAAALCLSLAGCKSKAERDLENLEPIHQKNVTSLVSARELAPNASKM